MLIAREFTTCGEIGLENTLADLVEQIREYDERRRKIASLLKGFKNAPIPKNALRCGEIIGINFVEKVAGGDASDLTVAGIDSGLLDQQLHGLDLMLIRTVATIFHYHDGKLERAEYHPSRMPMAKLTYVTEPVDSHEFELIINMERLLAEVKLATETVRSHEVNLLLLDGSVVPRYVERVPQGPLTTRYIRLLEAYDELYTACHNEGVLLAGVVKDSRSARFIEILRQVFFPSWDISLSLDELKTLEHSRDTVLLDHILSPAERTFAFSCQEVSDGLKERKAYGFYMKTVPYDRPLRVEFITDEDELKTANRMAELIHSISAHHPAFALPSVLVEADMCAHLASDELELVQNTLVDRLGLLTPLDLRRHRKPF